MATPTFSSLHPTQTAALVSTYVPPFATGSTFVASIPASTGASLATSARPADPTVPAFSNDLTWTTAYLTIHSLSKNSYVYMYILWLAVAAVFLALSVATWSGARGGALGARFTKWALRRRTWRKKHALRQAELDARRKGLPPGSAHRQPVALPSNAQLLSASALFVGVAVLCVVGPDYINPDLSMFNFSQSTASDSATSLASAPARRTAVDSSVFDFFIPRYTIDKAFWTAAARTGGVAFALYPLTILLALKSAPFALFAIPGLVGYSHDKMIRLHRWVGRLVWLVTAAHVALWIVQVCRDRRAGTGELVINYVWGYPKFRYGWVAFGSLTLLMLTTLSAVRGPHYELFYAAHVLLTPAVLVFSALHHPPVWQWCWAALALWAGERAWRATWWVYVNGVCGIGAPRAPPSSSKGRDGTVVQPYTYSRPGEYAAARAPAQTHRPAARSKGSSLCTVATLTDAHAYEPAAQKGGGSCADEAWEMRALRAPAPRRAQPGGPLDGLGGEDQDRDSSSLKDFRDHASVRSAGSGYSYSSELGYRASGGSSRAPTPGEVGEQARGQALHVLTAFSSQPPPVPPLPKHAQPPAYPPAALAHGSGFSLSSPGAGPGPRSKAASLAAASMAAPPPHWQPQPGAMTAAPRYAPPPGFAHVTLLPGRTMRVRLVTPGYQTWAPGQHVLIGLPAVSRFATHPFSVASVCDEQAAPRAEEGGGAGYEDGERGGGFAQVEAGRELVLIVRAKKGWTKRLWELVGALQARGAALPPGEALPAGCAPPPAGTPGIVCRALVDGPFGSAARTRWGRYASVLVVAGGSGVSFGLSVLEYVCLCLAGRDGRFLGGHPGGWGVGRPADWVCQRVRFVWLVREYAHIQWVASSLRRCLDVVPTDALEINIFVTNSRPPKELSLKPHSAHVYAPREDGLLKPPAPRFSGRRASLSSESSAASDISVDSIVDMYGGGFADDDGGAGGAGENETGHDAHELDYTNFDGDDDTPSPGEYRLSRRLIKESTLRRRHSRKVGKALASKRELEERAAAAAAADAAARHAKTPSDELYDAYDPASYKRVSTVSEEPLLGAASPVSPPSALSPTTTIRHVPPSAYAHAHAPPFGSAHSRRSSGEFSPLDRKRLSSASSWTAFDARSPGGSDAGRATPPPPLPLPALRWAEPAADAEGEGAGRFAVDAQEARDLQVVSEWARPGKPKLRRILADEVEAAKGRIAVACCGPTSLNALMRKLIAEQIDPARVARGDLRGSIDFIAEDFEY
ncbi:hypothetical protein DFH11DRAFT_1141658 [Phellopilus nigrolimitatus]|nr:hypothetical protein DFH11DRAFT_1141658 [Phellopilus nigrolimitatus]